MNVFRKVLKNVRGTLALYEMLLQGDRVVAAVSGGADSVCLLHVLHSLREELGIQLIVAHLDHGLRPEEDAKETRFVAGLADNLGHPFVTEKACPALDATKGSLEERARDVRYAFLRSTRERFQAHKIALGHTLDDQAETLLLRLVRGSGRHGLSGIPPVRNGGIIRPLIGLTRQDVEGYLKEEGLGWMTDSSNQSPVYLRNRIRQDVLPALKTIQPGLVSILGRTAQTFAHEYAFLEGEASRLADGFLKKEPHGEVLLFLKGFLAVPEALKPYVIRRALTECRGSLRGIAWTHHVAIQKLARSRLPHGQIHLSDGLVVQRHYHILRFSIARKQPPADYLFQVQGPGAFAVPAFEAIITLEEMPRESIANLKTTSCTALVDADSIDYPLIIRNARPGDRLVPLGMTGTKKIKKLFIDRKVSPEDRKRIPLLVHQDRVVWVCGMNLDNRFRVRPETRKVLRVTLTKDQGAEDPPFL